MEYNLDEKKLLIITGAGSSIEFGMPSVQAIDRKFEGWAQRILPIYNDKSKSLYSYVKEKIKEYHDIYFKNSKLREQNFESSLFTIQNIWSLIKNKQNKHFNPLVSFVTINEFPDVFYKWNHTKTKSHHFKFLHEYLTDQLLIEIRRKCISLSKLNIDKINKLRVFFSSLKEEFDLGFINLNYDNVILAALPELSTGFDKKTGDFNHADFYSTNWNFCYHIHGSVHFDMDMSKRMRADYHPISWKEDLEGKFYKNAVGRSSNYTKEGLYHLNSNIIVGLNKVNQILKEPFKQYFMKLDRLIYEADSIMFIGYGFNDFHLNKLFPTHRMSLNKIRKVAVIDWAADDTKNTVMRNDGWVYRLFETIPFNSYKMGNGQKGLPPETIECYKQDKTFEFSSEKDFPLSIWYNGLLEACDYVDKFIKVLI